MPDVRLPADPIAIGDALRALPLETPDRSAWPAIQARLQRPPRRLHWPWALAAAAVLAAVVVLPLQQAGPTPDAPKATPLAVESNPLLELMNESAQLEQLLTALRDPSVGSASDTLIGIEFEDRLAQLDARLAQAGNDPDERLQLWRQRVQLLRDYAGVESTRRYLASEGERLDSSLVAVF